MADTKLSALTELAATPASDDEMYVRDVSEVPAAESKRITIANLMAAGGATIVRKTSDETVSNNNTLQSDDELLFAVGANESWEFYIFLLVTGAQASDHKFGFAFPVAGVGKIIYHDAWESGDSPINPNDGSAKSWERSGTWSGYVVSIWGVYIGGVNAGNVQLQWAQNTAVEEDTKVLTDSFLIANKIS